jgi:hypothetical protein
MTNVPYTHLLRDNCYDFFLVFSLPRGRSIGNLTPALLPIHLIARGGAGGIAGWVLPCFPSLLMRGGVGEKGTTLTHDNLYLSYVLHPMFPGIPFPILVLTHTYIK